MLLGLIAILLGGFILAFIWEDGFNRFAQIARANTANLLPSDQSIGESEQVLAWNEIENLLAEWDNLHHYVDNTWDTTSLSSVLTGEALEQQQETVDWLQAKNCRWSFVDLAPIEILEGEEISSDQVRVVVRKHWDADLLCNGRADPGSFDEPFVVEYSIVVESDTWKIAKKVVIQK